MYGLGGIGVNY